MTVVAVAYGAAAPELSVAEFAPAARSAVEAPPTTAPEAVSGSRAGSGRRAGATTTTAPLATQPGATGSAGAAPTTRLARTRSCVGQPPRQIEDPMAPPCLATIFEGDNGGPTATGVTATEIAVAVPGNTVYGDAQRAISAIFEFFNQRFEFYGRRLRPVYVTGSSFTTPAPARAFGADIAGRNVFGTLAGVTEWDSVDHAMFNELARRGVVTVARGIHASDRTLLDELHPYLWTSQPSTEQWQRNTADFACSALADRPARFALNPALHSTTRRFGIVTAGANSTLSAQAVLEGLRSCGEDPATLTWVRSSDSNQAQLRTGLGNLKASGVTTLICLCTGSVAITVYGEAGKPSFGPELLVPMFTEPSDEWWQGQAYRTAMFGITSRPKSLPLQAQPWFQALKSIDPQLAPTNYVGWYSQSMYDQLLVLAAGIQGAGPHLTPDTFAASLMSTTFPNAGAGQAPYWQPSVGFGPGDHSFVSDYAVSWWSEQADAVDPQSARAKGSWCYMGQGSRSAVGRFPTDDSQLFRADVPCR